jgi:hypothetical protein
MPRRHSHDASAPPLTIMSSPSAADCPGAIIAHSPAAARLAAAVPAYISTVHAMRARIVPGAGSERSRRTASSRAA